MKKNDLLRYIGAGLLICCVLAATSGVYITSLNQMLSEESRTYLDEVATQTAEAVRSKLEGDLQMLRAMAVMLGNQGNLDVNYWVPALQNEGLFAEFQRVGLILPDGRGYGQDVSGTDFSDRTYFKQAMAGNCYISDVLLDRTTNVPSVTYAVPVFSGGEVVGVLAAVIHSDTYQKLMLQRGFGGRSYNYIVKGDGTILLRSLGNEVGGQAGNLLELINAPEAAVQTLMADLAAGDAGQMDNSLNGQPRLLSYTSIGVRDWMLISVVPYDTVLEKSQSIMHMTLGACAVVAAAFLCLSGYILINSARTRKKLTGLAYDDALTGIANKNRLNIVGQQLLHTPGARYVYVIMDVNKFKTFNDLFGYAQGDVLLRYIAKLLSLETGDRELAARTSADHFHMLLKFEDRKAFEARLRALGERISEYSFAANAGYSVTLCFGVYEVEDPSELLNAMGDKAEQALRRVKGMHDTSVFFYNEEIKSRTLAEQKIETDMRRAVDAGEFKLYLQPKIELSTGRVAGAEALVRWHHGGSEINYPDSFIPIFEKNGFITVLDFYMLECVCRRLSDWGARGLGQIPISVNQSRVHLYSTDYVRNVVRMVERWAIPTGLIELEITESAFFEDGELMIERLRDLHLAGFRISMDDFGSGYSSLNMLQDILVDELKIDRKFIKASANSDRGQKIVRNIMAMAGELKIQVVAEGVETEAQLDFLKSNGCDLGQGYYFSRPIPAEEFEQRFLAQG